MGLEGRQFGEFEILESLGRGGMGAVYKARQTSLGRLVALKTLQAGLADDAEYIERFRQEARAVAGLSHPNLVQVHSAGEHEGVHWFAMEYVEGESAKGRLKRQGRLEPLEAISIVMHVATALEYGWRKAGLIHRDIKPDNIFLSNDGEVKLGDLGLAKIADQKLGLTVTGHAMGTPHYISPEQVEATTPVDLRADIYSLGCTLFHLLSGQVPFDGHSAVSIMMKHVSSPSPVLKEVWPECPQRLSDVVGRMMRKDPAERPQSYAELLDDLGRAYDVAAYPESPVVAVGGETTGAPLISDELEPAPAISRPVGKAALKPAASGAVATSTAAPKKGPRVLYAGLAVLVLAIFGISVLALKHRDEAPVAALPQAQGHPAEMPPAVAPTTPVVKKMEQPPAYPQPAKWVEATENFPARRADYIAVEDGWMRSKANEWVSNVIHDTYRYYRNAAIRAVFRDHVRLSLRHRVIEGNLRYEASIGLTGCDIRYLDPGKTEELFPHHSLPTPLVAGTEHEAVFAVEGDLFTLWLDGKLVASAHDTRIDTGELWLAFNRGGADGDVQIKKLEYASLPDDPAKLAADAEAAATVHLSVLAPGAIRIWDTPERLPDLPGVRWEDASMRLTGNYVPDRDHIAHDASFSASVLMTPKAGFPQIGVRCSGAKATDQRYFVRVSPNSLVLYSRHGESQNVLKSWPLPRQYGPEEWMRVELKVMGDELSVSADGTLLGKVKDTSVTAPGWASLYAMNNAHFRDIVYRSLDFSGIKLWDTPEKVPKMNGVSWENDALRLDGSIDDRQVISRDGILHVSVWMNPDGVGRQIGLRASGVPPAQSGYFVKISPRALEFFNVREGREVSLQSWPLPRKFGTDEWMTVELKAESDQFSVSADGTLLGTVTGRAITDAGWVVLAAKAYGYFRDISYTSLDKPADFKGATASPGDAIHAARKD